MPDNKIFLSKIKNIEAVTESAGTTYEEACLICFVDQNHKSGTKMKITGDYDNEFSVIWDNSINDRMRNYWNDDEFTTEQAAYGIALLLVQELTDFAPTRRSFKTTGFDYWLELQETDDLNIFGNMARLEVSGIRNGTSSQIRSRTSIKLKQTTQSDNTGLPAFVVIVEFSRPISNVVKRL
jgi:hypothetical protein